MRHTRLLIGLIGTWLLVCALSACGPWQPTPVVITATPGPTNPPTDVPPPPAPTPFPTEAAREYRSYRHVSGVFSITVPADWEALDASTNQRLLVRYVPPIGYGSRVTVDITNEGPLPPDEVQALAESYVRLHYVNQSGYTEINRSTLPDGRLQFVFMYNDGRGATGRETLYIQQVGPYFTALRVFLSDRDILYLSQAMDTIVASFSVDALAVWGSAVAAINPAELLLVNTTLWRDGEGVTHYMGEVYNASPADITDIVVRVALCSGGIVMIEMTQPAALRVVSPGGSTPFAVSAAGMPGNVTVCAQQASASPASPDPSYTTALLLEPVAGFDDDDHLVIRGRVTNPGLSPVTNLDVVLIVYDSDNCLVGYHVIPHGPALEIAPGQSAGFEYTFPELGGEAARYLVLAQAEVVTVYNPSLAPGR